MASFLAMLEWRWLLTGDVAYKDIFLFWSNIVPSSLTISEASSSRSNPLFALMGTAIVLPVILVYNAMQWRVF